MDYALQRNALIASGALVAFSFNDNVHGLISFLLTCAAALVMLVAYLQSSRMKKYGMWIGQYLYQIEKAVYENTDLKRSYEIEGWEHAVESFRAEETKEHKEKGEKTILDSMREGVTSGKFGPSATKVDARFFIFGGLFIFLCRSSDVI